MRLLIQRVSKASVTVDEKVVGAIDRGLLVFLGIHVEDEEKDILWLVEKMINLRIFEDNYGKMNLSVSDIKGKILIVSQFTLYANCLNGRRPDFINSAPPEKAEHLYNKFVNLTKERCQGVETGLFAAKMSVDLVNEGPVTIILDHKN